MPFVRFKRRRGRAYGYLVENHWDSTVGQPRQRVLRYLGPAEEIRLSDLPKEVRTPALVRRLEQAAAGADARRASAMDSLRLALGDALGAGDFPRARSAALRAVREVGIGGLYGELIPQIFAEIGRRWASGSLSVSQEHLASGVAARVVEHVNSRYRAPIADHREVVLCVPEGENHTLALHLAEGLLRQKGFAPVNIGASAPVATIVDFVADRRPLAVLISVAAPDRLGPARTLALRIRRRVPTVRVILGGRGTQGAAPRPETEGVELVPEALPAFLDRWGPAARTPPARTGPRG